MSDQTSKKSGWTALHRADVASVTVLVTVCTLAWCWANDKWTLASLAMPAAYTSEPQKADVIHMLALMKATTEGNFWPLVWKQVPELGAPFDGNWNDWPMVEETVVLCHGLLAKTFGLFAGLNLVALLGNVSAALAFYAAARVSACNPLWSTVGGLAFGLSPWIFAHSPFHLGRVWIWQLPLFLPIWRWVSTEPGIVWRSPRCWLCVGLGFLFGIMNQYFSYVFCQLVVLGAGIQYVRTRNRTALLSACAIVAAACAGFLLMQVDTWTYWLANGPNRGALVREYKWLEIYGLKIKDLVIPPVTHHSDAVAAFSAAHRQAAPLLDEDGASYQGILGLSALAWLIGTAVASMVRGRERDVPMEAWQILWIVAMFTTGGLNAIVAAFGLTLFRGGCTYTIAILAISLFWAARRLSALQTTARDSGTAAMLAWAGAAVATLVILWDQVPRSPTREFTADIARRVAADREFTERIEAALPSGSMVFQLPVMDFPESPLPGMAPYDHFRPYLYSRNLRYSFGSMKGRERDRWQREVQDRLLAGATVDQPQQKIRFDPANVRLAIDAVRERGFAALYINRDGFPDRGRGLEEALLDLGYTSPPIRNAIGDLACVMLDASGGPAVEKPR
jgi:hypothetical protein